VVDIGHAPYRTHARLYEGGPVFEIEWYEALPSAPCLPYPSAISNLIWERDREEWLPTIVGEIYGAPRTYHRGKRKPLASGLHQCGTAADYAGAGVYDPTSPPVVYRNDGLPICCGPGAVATGGAVGGGSAVVVYTRPAGGAVGGGTSSHSYTRPAGGAVGGGTSSATWASPVGVSGGAVGGGSAEVEYTPPVVGSGGGVGGGSVSHSYTRPDGGAVGGGSPALVLYYTPEVGSGGAVGGGSAVVEYTPPVVGSGGAVGGGSADVSWIPDGFGCDLYDVTPIVGPVITMSRTGEMDWAGSGWSMSYNGVNVWVLFFGPDEWFTLTWDGTGSRVFDPQFPTTGNVTVACGD
jgi:hypothetical protein